MFNIFKRKYLHLILVSEKERENLLLACILAKIKGKDIEMKRFAGYFGYIYQIVCSKEQYKILSTYCSFTEVEAK